MKTPITTAPGLPGKILLLLCACAAGVISAGVVLSAPNDGTRIDAPPFLFSQTDKVKVPDDNKNRGTVENPGMDGEVKDEKDIRDLSPQKKEKIPLAEAMAVDFVIPGGGALYYENYYYGIGFAALKLAGVWATYYYYTDWKYRRSLYYSARGANSSIDPDHELQFKVPGGGYKTAAELKQDYDRAAQRITFSVIGTAMVYVASLLVTYHEVEKFNESAVPTFEISFACDRLVSDRGSGIIIYFTYRM